MLFMGSSNTESFQTLMKADSFKNEVLNHYIVNDYVEHMLRISLISKGKKKSIQDIKN